MGLFPTKWLKNLIRKNTNLIPHNRAEKWQRRLSVMYALIAWNALGFVGYMVYTGRNDWAKYYGVKSEEDQKMGPGNLSELTIKKRDCIK